MVTRGVTRQNHSVMIRIVVAICWNIWRERNSRIFRNKPDSVGDCLATIFSDINSWTCSFSDSEARLERGPMDGLEEGMDAHKGATEEIKK